MWLARARVSPASALEQGDHRRRFPLPRASVRCTVSRGAARGTTRRVTVGESQSASHDSASQCAAFHRDGSSHLPGVISSERAVRWPRSTPSGAVVSRPNAATSLRALALSRLAQHQLRPHIDGNYSASKGVRPGQVAHFVLLCMLALSDVPTAVAGNTAAPAGGQCRARARGAPPEARPTRVHRRADPSASRGPGCPRRPSRYAVFFCLARTPRPGRARRPCRCLARVPWAPASACD